MKSDGTLLKEGDLMTNPKLGMTLRRVADNPHAFYNGSLAQDIVDDIAEYNGNITLSDLQNMQNNEAIVKQPLKVSLQNGGYTLYNPPPPSSGAVIDYIMSLLDGALIMLLKAGSPWLKVGAAF
jgi:gamma-glutamyltranspeptidase / glutathione hydrolase / leukotriene-C4 hydrolase